MTFTTVSSRKFNQDASKIKKAAKNAIVYITNRGRVSHVLLSIEQYRVITEGSKNIVDQLTMPEVENIDFSPPRMLDENCSRHDGCHQNQTTKNSLSNTQKSFSALSSEYLSAILFI